MLERKSFVGGRTEAWWVQHIWDGEAHDVDVNNLYGWVMRERQVPTRLVDFRVAPSDGNVMSPEELEELLDLPAGPGIIADVTVDMREPAVPLKAEKLLFPVGQFRTTLCSPELRLAMKLGTVMQVHAIARYEMAYIFKEAVEYFSQKRIAAETAIPPRLAERRLMKDMNNNLYGKFGQMAEEWERIGDAPPNCLPSREHIFAPDGRQMVIMTIPAGIYQWDGARLESFNAFPAVAAFITSWARVKLWSLRVIADGPQANRALVQNCHALYCDTDALIVDRVGYDRLRHAGVLDPVELGKMKEEWAAESVNIEGAKWYSAIIRHEPHLPGKKPTVTVPNRPYTGYDACGIDQHGQPDGTDTSGSHTWQLVKRKGVPERAVVVQTPSGPRFSYDQFPRLDGHIGDHDVSRFHNRRVLKKTTVEYNKGVHLPEGGWCRPFRLPDDAVMHLVAGVEAT